jgi:hypothetical protein
MATSSVVADVTYVTITFAWTRNEFSAGSKTEMYERTSNVFAGSTRVLNVNSSVVGTTLTKVLGSTNYYYWVRHVLSDGTAGTETAITGSPVQYLF